LITERDLTQEKMNLKGPHTDPLLQTRATAAEQGAAAGCQLLKTERFPKHIIRSCIQERNNWL
jgi:hypothetical protein